jgi:WD40 repeat protein
MKHLIFLTILFIGFSLKAQDFKQIKTIQKQTKEIVTISASNDYFATGSYDRNVFVYDYNGKKIFKYKNHNAVIGEVILHPDSSYLFLSITETKDGVYERPVIKCFDLITGQQIREFIDTTITQAQINAFYEKNTTGVKNAMSHVENMFPEGQTKSDINYPRVEDGLSHIERIQSLSISDDFKYFTSMDKYNILKIWDTNGDILNSFQVTNNKVNTDLYFLNDSTLLITPNILLNITDYSSNVLTDYQDYKRSIPIQDKIFFFSNIDIESSKLVDYSTDSPNDVDVKDSKCYRASYSADKFAFLGIDGLVRICDFDGQVKQKLGKDRTEMVGTRDGGSRLIFSEIEEIKLSPNGKYLITGDKFGKVIIWGNE